MKTKTFQRRIESFTCLHCGAAVQGNGYTNHCPTCLWSRHVDVNPGDRAATCGGMMEPVDLDYRGGEYTLTHRCTVCPHTRRNRVGEEDSRDALVAIARK